MIKKILKAPNFSLPSTENNKFFLKRSKGKNVVLYFYPKDDTPGCTLETKDFNSLLSKFNKLNCEIYGISKDNIESHQKFKKKYNIKFDLLADEKKKVIKTYKSWGKKKFMGKEFMGVIRSTYLINVQGNIIKIWKNVRVLNHASEVLET
jgi:peroxiredoxin Q/BCP